MVQCPTQQPASTAPELQVRLTDRYRRALEDDNDDRDEADKGRTEASDNGGGETVASRAGAGSLHRLPLGIRLPSRPRCLRLEAEEWEVTLSELEEESEAASEEEVKVEVEDRCRFFRPCRCINFPFTRLRVSAKGGVAVAAAVLEAEDGCVPGGA